EVARQPNRDSLGPASGARPPPEWQVAGPPNGGRLPSLGATDRSLSLEPLLERLGNLQDVLGTGPDPERPAPLVRGGGLQGDDAPVWERRSVAIAVRGRTGHRSWNRTRGGRRHGSRSRCRSWRGRRHRSRRLAAQRLPDRTYFRLLDMGSLKTAVFVHR